MKNDARRLATVAVCVYTAAFLVTVLLHEVAHALAALAVGIHPTLFNSHVDTPPAGPWREILIALAGPVFSLVQCLVGLVLAVRGRGTGAKALFGLFLGVFGTINFLGYVMTGPVVDYGDVCQAEKLLGVPIAAAVISAVAAAVVAVLVVRRTAPLFMRFVPTAGPGATPAEVKAQKRRYLWPLLGWPWLLGSILITVLGWPLSNFLSVIYPPMSSMVLGVAFGAAVRRPALLRTPTTPAVLRTWLWGPVLALSIMAIVFRLLSAGVQL